MARIRAIKPEFFLHERLAQFSALHRLLFQGLWCHADSAGRLEDRPRRLITQILPYDGLSCDIFDAMLSDLAESAERFIIRYHVGGERYIWIPKFLEHQRPHRKDAASVIPPYEDGSETFRGFPGKSGEGTSITVHAPLSKSPRILKKEEESVRGETRLAWFASLDPFVLFWLPYPQKTGKQGALRAWKKLDPSPDLLVAILAGIARWRASERWTDGYVCDPATFLGERYWEDDPPPPKPQKLHPLRPTGTGIVYPDTDFACPKCGERHEFTLGRRICLHEETA